MEKGNNKGEWSEFYAFLKILEERKIFAADKNLEIIDGKFFVFHKIIREEKDEAIKIYDISGREVITLINRVESAGYKSISWNARDNNGNIVPSGVYIYSIESANYRAGKKMLLMK